MGEFWKELGGQVTPAKDNTTAGDLPLLLKVSDESGSAKLQEVGKGTQLKRNLLSTTDTFLFDVGFEIFVWEGKKSNKTEKQFAAQAVRTYRDQYNRPQSIKITRCMEGGENEIFEYFLAK